MTQENILEKIMDHNQTFVSHKEYTKFATSNLPDRNMVIVSCMDTRLTTLLPEALGIKNGDAKMIKNAGGTVLTPMGSAMRSILVALYAFNVTNVLIIGHDKCGMAQVDNSPLIKKMQARGVTQATIDNLDVDVLDWLAGFESLEETVASSVNVVKDHPLVADDVNVYGLIINPETGELRTVIS